MIRKRVDIMTKCTYVKICKHYREDSFTYNGGNKCYCGIFRSFHPDLTKIKVDKYLLKKITLSRILLLGFILNCIKIFLIKF